MSNTVALQRKLGYQFNDPALFSLALTHRSMGSKNNERLEFLGDSILNHVVAEALFRKFPDANEGEMSRMRASLVKGETLAEVARELSLGECLALGIGERKSGGRHRGSILADALEAVLGAILLDSSVDRVRACIHVLFESRLQALGEKTTQKDAKTQLQEYLQARHNPLPIYELIYAGGNDHNLEFEINCKLAKPSLVVKGVGSSRRKAEQSAAELALSRINAHGK